MYKHKVIYLLLILSVFILSAGSNGCFRPGRSTSIQPENQFRSDKYYLTVELPEGWAGIEGPECLVWLCHIEGDVAFNSWEKQVTGLMKYG